MSDDGTAVTLDEAIAELGELFPEHFPRRKWPAPEEVAVPGEEVADSV